jgi:hypothetical protein
MKAGRPTAIQAEQYGALAPPTPLIVEFPLRPGVNASISMPLGATSAEINRLRLYLEAFERETAGHEARRSPDGLSVLQRELEALDRSEPISCPVADPDCIGSDDQCHDACEPCDQCDLGICDLHSTGKEADQ